MFQRAMTDPTKKRRKGEGSAVKPADSPCYLLKFGYRGRTYRKQTDLTDEYQAYQALEKFKAEVRNEIIGAPASGAAARVTVVRGEEDKRQLYLDLCREVYGDVRDLEAEVFGRERFAFDNASAVPVNEAERAHNREHESARNSSAASVEREERESRQRMKQRALFFERETQHKSRKGSGSVGHDDGQDRKTG